VGWDRLDAGARGLVVVVVRFSVLTEVDKNETEGWVCRGLESMKVLQDAVWEELERWAL